MLVAIVQCQNPAMLLDLRLPRFVAAIPNRSSDLQNGRVELVQW